MPGSYSQLQGSGARNALEKLLETIRGAVDSDTYGLLAAVLCDLVRQNQDLRKRADLADALLAGADLGIIVYDSSGRVVRASAVAENLAGGNMCGLGFEEVAYRINMRYPDGRRVGGDELPARRALRGDAFRNLRLDVTGRGGNTVRTVVSAFPIMTDGLCSGAVVVWQDVTCQVDANLLLEGMFDALGDIVGIMRPDHTLIRYNRACYEMLGMSPGDVIGKKCYQLIGRKEACSACASEKAIQDREPARMERWFPELGMYLECRSTPILDESGEVEFVIEHIHDITERKQAEEELRKSKEQLELLLRNVRDLVYRIELVPVRRFTYASPAATALTGYSPEELVADPDLGYVMIHPDDRPLIDAASREEIPVEEPLTLRWIRKDGSAVWIEVKNAPVYDDAGNLVALEGIARDVTDRQRAREALVQSEQQLSRLFSNLLGMAYRCRNDRDWTMEFLSEGALGLSGYAPEEIVENRRVAYGDLIHPGDREQVWQKIQAALEEGKPFQIVYRLITADCEEKWVWEQGRGITGSKGEIIAVEGYVTDITQQIHAEQALAESEERYRSIFTSSHAVMLILDPDTGEVVDANPAASGYYGYPHERLISMKITDLNAVLNPEQARAAMQRARAGHRRHFVFRHRLANGEIRDVDAYVGIVTIHGRALLHAIVHDVTDRRRAEEALRESEERFRSIFEESPIAIVYFGAEGDLVEINPAGLRMFGLPDTYQARPFNLFSEPHIPEAERQRLEKGETVHYMIRFDFDAVREQHRYWIQGSGIRHFDVHITRMNRNGEGLPRGYVALVQDLTEQVQALDRIEQNIEQFAILADHIRQPLQVILGVSSLLDDPLTGKLMQEVDRINGYIKQLDRGWIESRKIREFLRRNEMM